MDSLFFPDHSTCITCKKPITWNEWSYTHDDTGFADCGITLDTTPLGTHISAVHETHQWDRYAGSLASPIERILGYL